MCLVAFGGAQRDPPGVMDHGLDFRENRRRFVREHTVRSPVPLVPEITMRMASEITPLWQVTESWLQQRGVPPPFWAFPWAGGQVLARLVLDQPVLVRGLRVLDFATGGGMVAMAAAVAGAAHVRAVDIDLFACAACEDNAEHQQVQIEVSAEDLVGQELPGVDVLLAGDIFYDQADAQRFLPWMRAVASSGVRVLVGDPGRTYAPSGAHRELAVMEVPTHPDLEGMPFRRARVLELIP